ncbi:MAG: YkgJ family cysteine cluster protein [Spirochaetes bacterium]|jgi:Fe-S-cluster containining protein|nr:YkgJ family cysteine cluster protein [Spirochaetota bacterium]
MMQNEVLPSSISLYLGLLEKIDAFEKALLEKYGEHISCRKGCSECCVLESVFPIEAFMMRRAVTDLAPEERTAVRENSENRREQCVFLEGGNCMIYGSRPVICRTHGYPIEMDGEVDFCLKNFKGLAGIDGDSILDLELLNTMIAAINLRFVNETDDDFFRRDRVPLAEILSD